MYLANDITHLDKSNGKVLWRPDYVKDFACDGSLCDSRCCRRWRIDIDGAAYERFGQIPPGERDYITSRLDYDEQRGTWKVRLRDDGDCPFLREDKLCHIQKEHGAEFLADICYSYPRITYRLPQITEQSLALTCPLALRLALLREEPVTFEQVPLPSGRPYMLSSEQRTPLLPPYTVKMQEAGLAVLQDRSVPLAVRLRRLGRFLRSCDEAPMGDSGGDSRDLRDYLRQMAKIFCLLHGENMPPEKIAALAEIYSGQYAAFYGEIVQPGEVLWENYLVAEYFSHIYPCAFNGTFFDNYKIFILEFQAMLFAQLANYAAARGNMTLEDVLFVIGRIAECFDHNHRSHGIIKEQAAKLPSEPEPFFQAMGPGFF